MQRLLLHVAAVVEDRIPVRRKQQGQTRSVERRSNSLLGEKKVSEKQSMNYLVKTKVPHE